jgi:hypothetical protein
VSLEFQAFPKIARLNRDCIITEKLDGTNAQVHIDDDGVVSAGSRTRWITPGKSTDNFGFAAWVESNADELRKLGSGIHFGEWWGLGIQRGYGLHECRFSLFNAERWLDNPERPSCCGVVPVLYRGSFSTLDVEDAVHRLREHGSVAAPGFMRPEGVIVWHCAARSMFKVTLEKDSEPKGAAA